MRKCKPMIEYFNEDCLEGMDRYPDNYIDLVVTSPPYDNLRDYKGYSFDYKKTISELYRIVKDGGVVVWIVNDATINGSETGTSFKQALYAKEVGFNLHDTMIWNKESFVYPSPVRYRSVFEYMFIFSKGKPKTVNLISDKENKYAGSTVHGPVRQKDGSTRIKSGCVKGARIKDFDVRHNVWKQTPVRANKTNHPAVFPIQLAKDHIITWSNEGDTILDPFTGSGTTGIAALSLGRKFIGFEIGHDYYVESKARLEAFMAQQRIETLIAEKHEQLTL